MSTPTTQMIDLILILTEVFSMWMTRDNEEVTQHIPAQLLAGFVAGGIAVVATNPMDVIKTVCHIP